MKEFDTYIQVRVSKELLKKMRDLRWKEGITISNQIRIAVAEKYFPETRGNKKDKGGS